ncbi:MULTISPECIES: DUF4174 domain-containing protein [Vibrio]|jgi:hypothetical protein|uniref:DUF4174 domain-containing protein n=1 Tax=Vibrio kanaloae TaxID=170673 RepID=A0A4U2CM78_9VIBR|nr:MULTISPECIES: DUF4174 domain-containing protein [Vibrio]KAB0465333.1 DUF4174 domain-containing protein [Vibrio kanaloae]MCG9559446.1 DUF4174 domain-containing protein [Vibrio kanaloae]NOI01889.1 DUF4174 domain-containing protein [Vibrio kanaloae]NOI99840.1 DUF4174 domain-containing protein [Vibrio kanaloae]QPK06144.1 DUF4174 domain-containing protein [Vibrio kanaloae]
MLHLQTHKPCVSLDTARSAQTSNDSNVCSNLLKFLTISTVLIMTLAISSALAYPASSHTNSLPHRSVIYFAPKEDSVVKEFLNEVLINNCQLDERDVVIMVIAESGYTVPTWLEEEFNLDAVTRIYKIPKGSHTAVLIGKDGKEKYRWSGKTDWQKITNIIDEMPMRQREMQRQSSRCSI